MTKLLSAEQFTMDTKGSISSHPWHIPRPSLSGSSTSGSVSDGRSRGGSASSQGSSSNHSTHSVSSGSMLLSAAYLARLNGKNPPIEENRFFPHQISNYGRKSTFGDTKVAIPEETTIDTTWSDVIRGSSNAADAASVASSTHFTLVNGYSKQSSKKSSKSCCCNQSHQITILVISMTILFSAAILAAICFVEMRMRKETGIYKYS